MKLFLIALIILLNLTSCSDRDNDIVKIEFTKREYLALKLGKVYFTIYDTVSNDDFHYTMIADSFFLSPNKKRDIFVFNYGLGTNCDCDNSTLIAKKRIVYVELMNISHGKVKINYNKIIQKDGKHIHTIKYNDNNYSDIFCYDKKIMSFSFINLTDTSFYQSTINRIIQQIKPD